MILSYIDINHSSCLILFLPGLVPLHNASSYGHYDVCETLIMAGADVNARDYWKFTPLHEAAAKGKVEVCSLLIRCGADPYLKDIHNKTAIDVAVNDKLRNRIVYEYCGYTFLNYIRNGEYSKLKKYLSSNAQNQTSSSINSSATADSSDSLLLSSPASPLAHLSYINAAHACLSDKTACGSYGACSSVHNSHRHQFTSDLIYFKNSATGNGPLHYLVDALSSVSAAKRKQIAEFLIKKAGVVINEANNDGLTPLAFALERDQFELAECFLRHKARIDIVDVSGLSVLHRMAQKNNLPAVKVRISIFYILR